MKWPKKITLIVFGSVLTMVVAIILLISPIAEYAIEKYDVKFTGRQIEMDWAIINPFTGSIHLDNVKIYELKSDSIFLSAKSLNLDVALLKLFSKTYELNEVTLTQPRGLLILNLKKLNIDDLIEKFSSHDSTKGPVHFNIRGIKIIDGTFYYRDDLTPINYFIRNVNLESSGKLWNADTIFSKISFVQGIGKGTIKGSFTINANSLDYRFDAIVHAFDLNIIQQYLKDLTQYGSFTATLEANIKAIGNFSAQEDITVKGTVAVTDFHFGKNRNNDYAAFENLKVDILELSPKKNTYLFDSILLNRPYFKYERYDSLDNIQTMFGKGGANVVAATASAAKFNLVIEIARYIKVLSKNFFQSDYNIRHIDINDADLKFNDYSINEKFSVDLNPLFISADSIDKDHKRIKVSAHSQIKPYGKIWVALSINPKDSSDFDMQYHVQGVPASLFNPYIITYTSFSLDRGTLEVKGTWHVRNGNIKSDNHLILLDPRTTKRLRTADTKWLPLPLIMSFVRERGNAVDYRIPITGDLKNPKFKLQDIFLDLLTNIFVKPPTTPYGLEVNLLEVQIEKSLTWTWPMRTSSVLPAQEIFIKRIADFLKDNPTASVTVHPQQYSIKEKEYILYFEAKKKYFLHKENASLKSFREKDSLEVDRMFIKDPSFIKYLNKQVPDSTVFTILEQCALLVGDETANVILAQLSDRRKETFLSYFSEKKEGNQIKFLEKVIATPYNGYSFYQIEYDGQFPKSIIKAYRQMKEYNDKAPRKKFERDRRKLERERKKYDVAL